MADALASGASACKGVRVRVPLSAYIKGDVIKEILWHLLSICVRDINGCIYLKRLII